MKKLIFIILLQPLMSFAQAGTGRLEENKIDEFTHHSIKRTYWEVLERASLSQPLNIFFRISKINENYFLDLKVMGGGQTVEKNAMFMLKLENDTIVTLYNLEHTSSSAGAGARGFSGSAAQGVQLSYALDHESLMQLMRKQVVKTRIYFSTGYKERNIGQNHAELLQKELDLIYHSK